VRSAALRRSPHEIYRRSEGGRFELFEARSGETIELASIAARLDVNAVYANPLGTVSVS